MGKYFMESERYKLEALLKAGIPKTRIAQILGKTRATVYNEINRGMVTLRNSDWSERTEYCADVAQARYDKVKKNKGVDIKLGCDYKAADFIETKIKEKYSPEAIAYLMNQEPEIETSLCAKTIYNYVHMGLFLSVSAEDLPLPRKQRREYHGTKRTAYTKKDGKMIDKRPEEINTRETFGHWEMDTVCSGKGSTACLLVLSERQTRHELIFKMPDKTQASTIDVLDQLERRLGDDTFREIFRTITVDNGVEFLDDAGIEKSALAPEGKRTEVYYCHPYSSFERGTNENINKMIRRWIPKGADIGTYDDDYIQRVQDWINTYPRKIHNQKSSQQLLDKMNITCI